MTKLLDMAITEFIDKMDFEQNMASEYDQDKPQLVVIYQDEGI